MDEKILEIVIYMVSRIRDTGDGTDARDTKAKSGESIVVPAKASSSATSATSLASSTSSASSTKSDRSQFTEMSADLHSLGFTSKEISSAYSWMFDRYDGNFECLFQAPEFVTSATRVLASSSR